MVNYCCVEGCNRNSRQNNHLNFYGLPKEKHRQVQWLEAAGREDLLSKDLEKLTHRFCSRHFPPSSFKNKYLCADAVPSLCLPDQPETNVKPETHEDIVCDNCGKHIHGFRYKCVTCDDFDLCQACEKHEVHPQHYMLRMPKPLKFKLADNLINQWRKFFKAEHVTPSCNDDTSDIEREDSAASDSSDNEPITKYVTRRDSGVDLSEDIKFKIRKEITRVLKIKENKKVVDNKKKDKKFGRKRSYTYYNYTEVKLENQLKESNKKPRMDGDMNLENDNSLTGNVPEVVFADVNKIKDGHVLDVKHETPITMEEHNMTPIIHAKLSDDLSELIVEVPKNQS